MEEQKKCCNENCTVRELDKDLKCYLSETLSFYTPILFSKLNCGYTFCRLYNFEYCTANDIYRDIDETYGKYSNFQCVLYFYSVEEPEKQRVPRKNIKMSVFVSKKFLTPWYPYPERIVYRLTLNDNHN